MFGMHPLFKIDGCMHQLLKIDGCSYTHCNDHCNIPKVVSYIKHQVCITPCACTHNNDTPGICIKDVDLSSEIGPHQKLRTYLQRQVRTGNCRPISENFNRALFVKFSFLCVLIRQSKLIELLQSKSIAKSKNFDSFQTGFRKQPQLHYNENAVTLARTYR